MSNIEELDDFELAIREKLANYETTPPVGSWNAIVQNNLNESRKLKIVWFNRSSFLIVLVASMFSMWLAFGSISFELSKNDVQNLRTLSRLKNSRINSVETIKGLNQINQKNTFNNSEKKYASIEKTSSINIVQEKLNINNNEEPTSTEVLDALDIRKANSIANTIIEKAFILTPQNEDQIFNYKSIPKLGVNLMVDYNILPFVSKQENASKSTFINNSILQQTSAIKLELTYRIAKNITINSGINFQKFYQLNNYTKEVISSNTRIDTSIIGYIQDPFLGKVPVYKFENVEYTELRKSNNSFTNEWIGLELPISLSYRFYKNKNLQMLLNINAAYAYYKANEYIYFNEEVNLVSSKQEQINMYTTGIALESNYQFNSFLSAYLKPSFSKSNLENINNGFGLSLGLKYKLY